jgi:mRNA-degrading endonuclease RelE of RelBE toxin-antitoxin system
MTWNLQIAGPAQKDLRKLPAKDQCRVKDVLSGMRDDPFAGDIVRLQAQPTAWRRRVGNYRIFFDLYPEQLLIVVLAIRRRTSTTY